MEAGGGESLLKIMTNERVEPSEKHELNLIEMSDSNFISDWF